MAPTIPLKTTGRKTSLLTKDRGVAAGLIAAKNQAATSPILNVAMAKVYLSAILRTSHPNLERINSMAVLKNA
ncbi:MAG TPA: hypothetical protein VGC39_04225 [Candidatus Methylacidiphilales bacterium]